MLVARTKLEFSRTTFMKHGKIETWWYPRLLEWWPSVMTDLQLQRVLKTALGEMWNLKYGHRWIIKSNSSSPKQVVFFQSLGNCLHPSGAQLVSGLVWAPSLYWPTAQGVAGIIKTSGGLCQPVSLYETTWEQGCPWISVPHLSLGWDTLSLTR